MGAGGDDFGRLLSLGLQAAAVVGRLPAAVPQGVHLVGGDGARIDAQLVDGPLEVVGAAAHLPAQIQAVAAAGGAVAPAGVHFFAVDVEHLLGGVGDATQVVPLSGDRRRRLHVAVGGDGAVLPGKAAAAHAQRPVGAAASPALGDDRAGGIARFWFDPGADRQLVGGEAGAVIYAKIVVHAIQLQGIAAHGAVHGLVSRVAGAGVQGGRPGFIGGVGQGGPIDGKVLLEG